MAFLIAGAAKLEGNSFLTPSFSIKPSVLEGVGWGVPVTPAGGPHDETSARPSQKKNPLS